MSRKVYMKENLVFPFKDINNNLNRKHVHHSSNKSYSLLFNNSATTSSIMSKILTNRQYDTGGMNSYHTKDDPIDDKAYNVQDKSSLEAAQSVIMPCTNADANVQGTLKHFPEFSYPLDIDFGSLSR